jgi:hypothetical protein
LEQSAAAKIAQYRFRLFGAAEYPDATSTPRVEFGTVKGYVDRAGVPAPYAATFSGLYYRVNDAGPYSVPKRWVDGRASLNVVTPLDFVSTCDIGSGNYTSEGARAVHVAAQGIVEALQKIYRAAPLLKELVVQ